MGFVILEHKAFIYIRDLFSVICGELNVYIQYIHGMCGSYAGEFGSERLVQRVVDTILRNTAKRDAAEKVEEGDKDSEKMAESWNAESSSKIILTGHKVMAFPSLYNCTFVPRIIFLVNQWLPLSTKLLIVIQ